MKGGDKLKLRVIVAVMLVMLALTLQSALLLPVVKAANPILPDVDTDITVAKAYAMIYSNSYPSLVVMDVRTAANYVAGHILGAINVPITPIGGGFLISLLFMRGSVAPKDRVLRTMR
jgi:hypothetical protein